MGEITGITETKQTVEQQVVSGLNLEYFDQFDRNKLLGFPSAKAREKIVTALVEAINFVVTNMQIPKPEIYLMHKWHELPNPFLDEGIMDTRLGSAGKYIIRVRPDYILQTARLADSPNPIESRMASWQIKADALHELHHIRQFEKYPKTIERETEKTKFGSIAQAQDNRWRLSRAELVSEYYALKSLKAMPTNGIFDYLAREEVLRKIQESINNIKITRATGKTSLLETPPMRQKRKLEPPPPPPVMTVKPPPPPPQKR